MSTMVAKVVSKFNKSMGHEMLGVAAATLPSVCIDATCTFRNGAILVMSWWMGTGVIVFVLRPFIIASTLTRMREGDIVQLTWSDYECTWVLLKPIGDGHGLLASYGSADTSTLSERRLLRMNVRMGIRVVGRLGLVNMVNLILAVQVGTKHAADCELQVLLFRLQRHVCIVQRAWRRALADPGYSICRTRLLREATEINKEMVITSV
jgi:hypothetical protein